MKRKNKVLAACLFGFVSSCFSFSACGKTTSYRETDICSQEVRAYLEAETAEEQFRALASNLNCVADYQTTDISYEREIGKIYRVFCENVDDAQTTFVLKANEESISGGLFIPGDRYVCKVVAMTPSEAIRYDFANATIWKDEYESFVVAEDFVAIKDSPVRNISLQNGYNYRDLGGWNTESGKKIKYGLVYRGGKTNDFSEKDKTIFTSYLHIKSEIDLRNENDDGGQTSSILGENCTYLKAPILQYSYILPSFLSGERKFDEESPKQIKKIFEFLSNESHYPLFFHCNAGADRTGTLAFLLCGSLGVSMEDLTCDFELTSFSLGGLRARGKFENPFSYGVMQDNADNFVAWGDLTSRMLSEYETKEGTLSSCIRRYLTEVCDVKEETIEEISRILLQ